jgi:GrpB-like predicted nucleotidyltransferase (UPF0157 family)
VPHDYRWADWFRAEAAAIRAALGDYVLGIEHFGSTAVPGLNAKLIVDILVGADWVDEQIRLTEDVDFAQEFAPRKWSSTNSTQARGTPLGPNYLGPPRGPRHRPTPDRHHRPHNHASRATAQRAGRPRVHADDSLGVPV